VVEDLTRHEGKAGRDFSAYGREVGDMGGENIGSLSIPMGVTGGGILVVEEDDEG